MDDATELTVEIERETAAAYLVHDGNISVWLPKSLIYRIEILDSPTPEEFRKITIPEWLALKKGLI